MDMKKYAAEAIGTFWGSAVIAAGLPQVGIAGREDGVTNKRDRSFCCGPLTWLSKA